MGSQPLMRFAPSSGAVRKGQHALTASYGLIAMNLTVVLLRRKFERRW